MAENTDKSLSDWSSIHHTSHFDEEQWVNQILTFFEEAVEEEDMKIPASIYHVPQALLSCKPEAYIPQLVAFGPYHHRRPQLYNMERYKLVAARRMQARLKFTDLVEEFEKHNFKIRNHYHKYLELSAKTIAWMMAIDASFLLEFLQNSYVEQQAQVQQEGRTKTLSKRMEYEKRKMGFNMVLRDILMLENQIPLFLLKKLLKLMYPSKELAKEKLSKILIQFVKEVSPFKTKDDSQLLIDNITHHTHLLELFYFVSVPKTKEPPSEIIEISEQNDVDKQNDVDEQKEEETADAAQVKKLAKCGWNLLSSLNAGPIHFIKRALRAKPLMFVVKFPWKTVTALPIFSHVKLPVENLGLNMLPNKPKSDDDKSNNTEKPPLVEEIAIPSVTELVRAGINFMPTNGDIRTITFDTKTMTLYLPVIHLDVNTEVILRNLVAYEASVVTGPLVFARYTELMYGIIDTKEDVHILRAKGVIKNRMKSDDEAAKLWNGMTKSVRLSKVGFLDKTIGDVNAYYSTRWRVKIRDFMKKYIFGSWQVLTFLAAGLLLFMTCVETFCSVYSCNSHLKELTNMGG